MIKENIRRKIEANATIPGSLDMFIFLFNKKNNCHVKISKYII